MNVKKYLLIGTVFLSVVFMLMPSFAQDKSVDLDREIGLIEFKDLDMMAVLKFLSQRSGINFSATQSVNGRVNLYLKDVSVREVLDVLAASQNLAYVVQNDIVLLMKAEEFEADFGHPFGAEHQTNIINLTHIKVDSALTLLNEVKSPKGRIMADNYSNTLIIKDTPQKLAEIDQIVEVMDVPLVTQAFHVKYAEVDVLGSKLLKLLTPTVGTMEFDIYSNRIMVTDREEVVNRIRHFIATFDKRQLAVSIESKIIQVALSDEFKLGVNWEGIVQDFHELTISEDLSVLNASDKFGRVKIGTLAADNYTAMIETLETIGDTKILSNPHITALNKQEAKILVGSSEPYVTSTTTTPSSGPTTVSETVNFIEVGVKLFATPTIHDDGFITMKIKPEVSSVTRNLVTSNNNTIPIVETSEAETTVMVKDGATIVIGGLIREERIDSKKRIPILGQIPLIGLAFQSQDNLDRLTEIVIFLTPNIVTGESQDLEPYDHILNTVKK